MQKCLRYQACRTLCAKVVKGARYVKVGKFLLYQLRRLINFASVQKLDYTFEMKTRKEVR